MDTKKKLGKKKLTGPPRQPRGAAAQAPAVQHPRIVHRMVEDVVGCKWSLTVLGLVRTGVRRPGSMTRQAPGLSPKVLNERLRKLTRFGIISRKVFPEAPPRVEYTLTPFGRQFARVLDQVDRLNTRWGRSS